jgi:hypothetical protein
MTMVVLVLAHKLAVVEEAQDSSRGAVAVMVTSTLSGAASPKHAATATAVATAATAAAASSAYAAGSAAAQDKSAR